MPLSVYAGPDEDARGAGLLTDEEIIAELPKDDYFPNIISDDPAKRELALRHAEQQLPWPNIDRFLVSFAEDPKTCNKIALSSPDGSWTRTCKEVVEDVDALAQRLQQRGIGRGSRVGMLAENGPQAEAFIHFCALAKLGAVTVPWTEEPMESGMTTVEAMEHGNVQFLVVRGSEAAEHLTQKASSSSFIADIVEGGRIIAMDNAAAAVLPAVQPPASVELSEMIGSLPSDTVAEMFTTGTGGDTPTRQRHTNLNILFGAEKAPQMMPTPEDIEWPTSFQIPAMYHIYGLSLAFQSYGRSKLVFQNGHELEDEIETGRDADGKPVTEKRGALLFKEVRPNLVAGIPLIWDRIAAGIEEGLDKVTGHEKFFAGVIKEALAARQVRVAEEDIDLCLRLGFDEELMMIVREYWAPILAEKEKIPTGIIAAVRRGIGNLLFPSALRKGGFENLQMGRGTGINGGGAIRAETIALLRAIGIILGSGYGLTQSTGAATAPTPWMAEPLMAAGQPLPGTYLYEDDIPDEPLLRELLVAGPHIAESAEGGSRREGRLRTEDIGRVVNYAPASILDGPPSQYGVPLERLKRMFKTASGRSVQPMHFEKSVKRHPLFHEALMVQETPSRRLGLLVHARRAEVERILGHSISEDGDEGAKWCDGEVLDLMREAVAEATADSSERYLAHVSSFRPVIFPPATGNPQSPERSMKGELRPKAVERKRKLAIEEMFADSRFSLPEIPHRSRKRNGSRPAVADQMTTKTPEGGFAV